MPDEAATLYSSTYSLGTLREADAKNGADLDSNPANSDEFLESMAECRPEIGLGGRQRERFEGEIVASWWNNNYKWLFDGAGIASILAAIGWTIRVRPRRSARRRQRQQSGDNSVNIQGGRDVNLGNRDVR